MSEETTKTVETVETAETPEVAEAQKPKRTRKPAKSKAKAKKAAAPKEAPKAKASRIKYGDDGVPLCSKCGQEPRWLITRRSTGEQYYYSLGRNCETARQNEKRAKTKARQTPIAELGLNNAVVATLEKSGFATVRDLEKRFDELKETKGVGAKSVKEIEALLQGFELK